MEIKNQPILLYVFIGIITVVVFLFVAWSSTSVKAAKEDKITTPLREQWQKQLSKLCPKDFTYTKKVATDSSPEEVKTFEGKREKDSCICTVLQKNPILLADELQLAFHYSLDDRVAKDEMELSYKGDTVIAKRKAGSKHPLAYQTIVRRPNGTIVYIHSQITKFNWLYENTMELKASLDEDGQLQSSDLDLKSQVPLMNYQFHSHIQSALK